MPSKKKKIDWWGYLKKTFTWPYLKNILINLLKQKAMKIVLAKIAGIALIPGGAQVWLASFVVEFLFDKLVEPILKELELEGRYQIDVVEGKKKVRLLHENRQDADAVRDAFNNL
jgi:hypothetical protein